MLQVYSPCGDDFKNNCHYMAIFVCFVGIHFLREGTKRDIDAVLYIWYIYNMHT